MQAVSDEERRRRFEAIAAEVYEPVQRFLRRRTSIEEADDVLGDVLLVVWRRLDDVPADAVLPWCYGVARRTLANERRSARRRLRLLERLKAQAPPPPSFDPAQRDAHPELAEALSRLRATDREILTLWAWEQLEPREIAVVLGTTPNAAGLRLGRAKRRLATELRRDHAAAGHEAGSDTEDDR